MSLKGNTKKVYRTMRGKVLDMEMLEKRNELTPAVGNARVNARGDQLGPGGKIVRKKEQVLKDYYTADPRSTIVADEPQMLEQRAQSKQGVKSNKTTRAQQKTQQSASLGAAESDSADWVEDANGDFTKKGK